MAVTLEYVKTLIECPDITVFSDQKNALLVTVPHRGELVLLTITLTDGGDYLRYCIPYYLSLPNAIDPNRLLVKLLELNRNLKLFKFGCDPLDGEVSVSIEVALENAKPTRWQVERCLHALTGYALEERDRLRSMMTTGIYPESSDVNFTDTLDRLFAGYQAPTEEELPESTAASVPSKRFEPDFEEE